MAFTDAWVETDPDGSVIFVSQLDDSDRVIKKGIRQRLEGDPSVPDLTGLIEVGSWPLAPKPRKGAARLYVDVEATILTYDATKREDGRMAISSDTKRLFHVATAAVVEIGYVRSIAGVIASGGLTITAGGMDVVAGGARVTSGGFAVGGAPSTSIAIRVTGNPTNGSGSAQRGVFVDGIAGDDATGQYEAVLALARTPATVVVFPLIAGLYVASTVKGAGSTITVNYGLRIEDQTVGVTNYAIFTGAGLIQFGDFTTITVGNIAALQLNRGTAADAIMVMNQVQNLADEVPYITFQRASSPQFQIGVSTNGGALLHCIALNEVRITDSAATTICLISRGAGAGQAGLALWDFTAGAIKQVTFGANDSGAAGFKYLRVPN